MSDKQEGVSEWQFYSLGLKVGVPTVVGAVLYLLARNGDVMALVALAVLGTIVLIGLGVFVALAIMDRLRQAEQIRFSENMHENMVLLNQMQRAQGAQARSLLDSNARLVRMLPEPGEKPADIDALLWDVDEPAERRW